MSNAAFVVDGSSSTHGATVDTAPLRLAGELTLSVAAERRLELLALLATPQPPAQALRLDLSAIEACDSAGVQLLLALQHSLKVRQQALRLCAASVAVRQALAVYGLETMLRP
jgi:anti-anti-sigma factor